jgi:predicted nucleic acid-binding protein
VAALVLDTGALIALERSSREVEVLLARAVERDVDIVVPVGVVGQAWRDGARQARLARLLAADGVEVVALDDSGARRAGQLCGAAGTADVIDASVVLLARERGGVVVTGDGDDLRCLDPTLRLIGC